MVMVSEEQAEVLGLLPNRPVNIPVYLDKAYRELLKDKVIKVDYSPDGDEWVVLNV